MSSLTARGNSIYPAGPRWSWQRWKAAQRRRPGIMSAERLRRPRRVVAEDGIIALCTELSSSPGPALCAVGSADDLEQSLQKLREQQSADIPVAQQWARARSRARIYLLSGLREEQVERLGAAYVAGPQEVSRLIQRLEPCAILASAQHVSPTVAE